MSTSSFDVQVGYDIPRAAYLAGTSSPLETDYARVREVVTAMIASGELAKAGFDVGRGGGRAFRLGTLAMRPPINELDNVDDVCRALENILQVRCAAAA